MKTPPLYKAERKGYEIDEIIGYLVIMQQNKKYYIYQGNINDVTPIEINPETLQIQCSDGEFRPIGEVEIKQKLDKAKLESSNLWALLNGFELNTFQKKLALEEFKKLTH